MFSQFTACSMLTVSTNMGIQAKYRCADGTQEF